jgi:serine protease AprX
VNFLNNWKVALNVSLVLILVSGLLMGPMVARTSASTVIVDPELLEIVNALGSTDVVPAILTFGGDTLSQSDIDNTSALGITGIRLISLPMIGANLTKAQFESALSLPNLISIYHSGKLEYFNNSSNAITGVTKNAELAPEGYGYTGKGVGIAVLDSGIDATHQDLLLGEKTVQNVKLLSEDDTGLIVAGTSIEPPKYQENVANTDENVGHGTHVAGISAGTGEMSNGKYKGVAPDAHIVGVGAGLGLFVLNILTGWDYVITNKDVYNIKVVNNSYGSVRAYDPNHPLNLATKKAVENGMSVVFSAANSGPGPDTMNNYAKAPWVIGVAAGIKDRETPGTLTNFSSRGVFGDPNNQPTVTGPGAFVVSTRASTGLVVHAVGLREGDDQIEPEYLPYYTTLSGTSMSSPHVAGIVALMYEANPNLTPAEVKEIISETATPMPGYYPFEVGSGYVNALAALDEVKNRTKNYGAVHHQTYNAKVNISTDRRDINAPIEANSVYNSTFNVDGSNGILAEVKFTWTDSTNSFILEVTDPNGKVYKQSNLLALIFGKFLSLSIAYPVPGTYQVKVSSLTGLNNADTLSGFTRVSTGTVENLNDIKDHPLAGDIMRAVITRRMDSNSSGAFSPNADLKRGDLAVTLASSAGIRQSLVKPANFEDVDSALQPFVEAVVSSGAALKDINYAHPGAMSGTTATKFSPSGAVSRAELAKSLVVSFGLYDEAQANMTTLTTFTDDLLIPAELRGYVVVAANRGFIPGINNGDGTQRWEPNANVDRGNMAVFINRFVDAFRPVKNIR